MSSQRKDARWRLATNMALAGGIEWNEMSWADVTGLLQVADHELVRHPWRIRGLAEEWNDEPELQDELDNEE